MGMHQITLHGENDAVYAGFDRCEDQDNGWKITLQGQTNVCDCFDGVFVTFLQCCNSFCMYYVLL